MKYDIYLFSCVLRDNHPFFKSLRYDVQYRIVQNLYKDYMQSEFCDICRDPAECMKEYVQSAGGNVEEDDEIERLVNQICIN